MWSAMKKMVILVMGLAIGSLLFAQFKADSLLREGRKAYLAGDYATAIEIYREYYRRAKEAGDNSAAADALRLLGDTFRASSEMDQAIKQLELGLEIATEAHDSALIGRIHNRLAAVYYEVPDVKASESNAQMAIQFSEKAHDQANISNSLNILGAIYRNNKQYELALDALRESVKIQQAIGDTADIPNALNNMANTLGQMKRHEEAIAVAGESYAMAERMDIPVYTRYAAQMLSGAYRDLGNFERALYWKDKSVDIDKRIVDESKAKEISKLREEMDMAQKEKDMELLRNEGALKDQQIASKNAQAVATMGIGGLVLVVAVVFYLGRRRQVRANEALQQKNEQIAYQSQEINAINQSLELVGEEQARHKQRLEEINRVKDKLFSIISHDLRSPLNSIQGLLGLLKEGKLTEREFAYMTDTLLSRVENTTMLLDNLLNWSRSQMEGFAADSDKIDLGDIAQSVCHLLDYNARAKDIRVKNQIPQDLVAIGDRNMIDLVIRNLLSNAIKFTHRGGCVQIWAENGGESVTVAVKDDGPGIHAADLDKVMGEDYYFTLGTANEKGSGLGLRLCKEFLQKNNGRIWVEQNSDRGSTFWFSLPGA
jgi:two-component system, sensor histidine kinase and response regulator